MIIERVIREAKAEGGGRGGAAGKTAGSGKLKRTASDALVDRVAAAMAGRRMGSYILCRFDRPPAGAAPLADDAPRSVDGAAEGATLDRRENLIRLCAENHLQFNTLRMGRFSTMLLLHYWTGGAPRPLRPQRSAREEALAAQPSAERAIERLRSDTPSPLLGHPPSPTVNLQGTASKGFAALARKTCLAILHNPAQSALKISL